MTNTTTTKLLAAATLAATIACTPAAKKPGAFQIALPQKMSALSAADAANVHATIEIPGVLGESELQISRDLKTASGSFTVDVTKAETKPFTLKLTWKPDETNTVLLGRLTGTIAIAPHKDNALQPKGDYDTCGNAQPPCTLEFDLNRNGTSNLDDLAQDPSIDPRAPPPFVDVAPSDLAFPSGIQLGTFSRDVIVVENTSAHDVQVSAQLIDAPGATLQLFNTDPTAPVSAATRHLELNTLRPFDQVLVAVTFAPVNKFLTVGDVFITAKDPTSNVVQATRVRLLANVEGSLQQPENGFVLPTAPEDVGGGFQGHVEVFSETSLFNGLPITSIKGDAGAVSGLPATGETIAATFVDGAATIPADHVFEVAIPADHKLAVSLAGLSSDVDLAVLVLDDNDKITNDPQKNMRQPESGTSAEALELSNDGETTLHALVVLGRVDLTPAIAATPGALTVDKSDDIVPFSLSAHVTSTPEFTRPLSPGGGPLEGGTRVTLVGKRLDPRATISFADSVALDCTFTPLDATKEKQFDCTTPPGSLVIGKNPATIVIADPAEDEGGDGQAATLPEGFTYEPPAPRLDQLIPAAAPTTGNQNGDVITLKGAFFSQRNGAPKVFFDGVEATPVTFIDSTKIQVPAPPHTIADANATQEIVVVDVQNVLVGQPGDPPGTVHLSLASNPRNFTYVEPSQPAPTLSAVSPTSGSVDGGNTITLTGTGFQDNATVLLDGQKATNVVVLGGTNLQCTVPERNIAGTVDIEVINIDGQRASLNGAYSYIVPDPTVATAFPTTATTDGGTFVVIAGSGFRAGVSVSFVDSSGTPFVSPNVNRVSTTSILAATPQVSAEGDYTLKVANVDGHSATLSDAFHMVHASGPKPRIDSISPNTGNKDIPTPITITGANFRVVPGTNGPAILVGSTAANVTALSCNDTGSQCTLTAVFPTVGNAGPVVVRLIDDDGQSDTTVFTYFQQLGAPPVIDTLAPTTASRGATLTITGRGFDVVSDGQGGTVLATDARLIVGGQLVTASSATSTQLLVPVPNLDAFVSGTTQVAVELTNSDGQSTSATFLYVPRTLAPAPVIQSVSPGVAHVGDVVTISGSGFNVASVQVGAVVLTPGAGIDVERTNASQVGITVPDPGVTLPAVALLTVTNIDGTSVSANLGIDALPTAPPSISSIAPTTVQASGNATVTLSGSGFSQQGILTVAGNPVSATIAQQGNLATFAAPPHSDGTAAVIFRNPDGQSSTTLLSYTSTVTPPPPNAPAVISSIAPAQASTAGGDIITLTGTNFVDVGGTLKVAGAIVAQRTVSAGGTSVTFNAPASAQPGVATVTWENLSAPAASIFLVYDQNGSQGGANAPIIDSIAPDNGDIGGGTLISLFGNNFDPSDVVTIGGQAVSFTFQDPGFLSFNAPPIGGPATVSVRVIDQTGASASTSFRYTSGNQANGAAAVALVSPSVLHAFVPGDVVNVIGQGLDTVTNVSIETLSGQTVGGALLVTQPTSLSLLAQIGDPLPDTNVGELLQLRLTLADGSSIVSPPLQTAVPTVTATFGDPKSSPQVTLLGEHFNGPFLVGVVAGPVAIGFAPSQSDSVLTTGGFPPAVPGTAAPLAFVYLNIFTGAQLPPVVVQNGPVDAAAPLSLSQEPFNEPLPANQAFTGLTTVVDVINASTVPFGAPTVAHLFDGATGLDVATGTWSTSGPGFFGGDRIAMTLDAPVPVAPGNYFVRLESTESQDLATGGPVSLQARAVFALVPAATTDRGGPLGGAGVVFAGDVVVAEDTATGIAQNLGTVATAGCIPADRGCTFTGAFEIASTPGLGDGTFRICAVAPTDPVACAQSSALLTVAPPSTTTFDYTNQNCQFSGTEEPLAGDDRGGIAANATFGYYTGDSQTVRFDDNSLGFATTSRQLDGIFNDTATGNIFSLFSVAAGEPHVTFGPPGSGPFTLDAIERLDPVSLNPIGVVPLSQAIAMDLGSDFSNESGIFAGDDMLVLFSRATGQWFQIQISTGAVSPLGPHPAPNTLPCENWATWGVARIDVGGHLVVDFVGRNDNAIHTRDLVTDGESIAHQFANLSDMCSITIVPSQNRWYWHSEGQTELSPFQQETVGFCDLGVGGGGIAECGDGTCNGDNVISPSVPGVPGNIAANVPGAETAGFRLVYDLNLPDDAVFTQSGVPYSQDHSFQVPPGSYDRIAYYFELSNGGPTQFVWVSTDAFTPNASQIGVPTFQSGAVFQQNLTNTNVFSNVVTSGDGFATTNIEFWPTNYETQNAFGVPGADDSVFDFGDLRDPTGDYGSMQIHNFGTHETLFAYNRWDQANVDDVGIGTNPSGQPDFTFSSNANQFGLKHLQVLVHPRTTGTPEDFFSCNRDCASVCGNGQCEGPVENQANCPDDCGRGGGGQD